MTHIFTLNKEMYHNKTFAFRSVRPSPLKFNLQYPSSDRAENATEEQILNFYSLGIFSTVALSFVLGFYIGL